MATLPPTNRLAVRFHGLRRSGNHAVITWLCAHVSGTVVHLNDIRERSSDPYLGCEGFEVRGIPYWTCKTSLRDAAVYYVRTLAGQRPQVVFYPPYDPSVRVERVRAVPTKDLLLMSYENRDLRSVCSSEYERRRESYVGQSARELDVLLLRDPFNLFASMIKSGMLTPQNASSVVDLWKQHAREFLGHHRHLTYKPVAISFNQWTTAADYRRDIAKTVGFEEARPIPTTVHIAGGGSSFDGLKMNGRAAQMPVRDRWRSLAGDDFYESLFDAEVTALSDDIFGPVRVPTPKAISEEART